MICTPGGLRHASECRSLVPSASLQPVFAGGYLALAEANLLLEAMIAAGYRSPICVTGSASRRGPLIGERRVRTHCRPIADAPLRRRHRLGLRARGRGAAITRGEGGLFFTEVLRERLLKLNPGIVKKTRPSTSGLSASSPCCAPISPATAMRCCGCAGRSRFSCPRRTA